MVSVQPKLAPPVEVCEWDFSFSRSALKFRWRLTSDPTREWFCERIAGQAWCREADGDRGNLTLICQIAIDANGTITAWPPEGEELAILEAEPAIVQPGNQSPEDWANFPQGRDSHWRLCYFRYYRAWRCRDERTGELFITNGYHGMLNLNYFDGGTHVFHDGPVTVDSNGIVRFSQ